MDKFVKGLHEKVCSDERCLLWDFWGRDGERMTVGIWMELGGSVWACEMRSSDSEEIGTLFFTDLKHRRSPL